MFFFFDPSDGITVAAVAPTPQPGQAPFLIRENGELTTPTVVLYWSDKRTDWHPFGVVRQSILERLRGQLSDNVNPYNRETLERLIGVVESLEEEEFQEEGYMQL